MIKLGEARIAAAGLADEEPVKVSARWLRQAIYEIQRGRMAEGIVAGLPGLDYKPAALSISIP